MKLQSLCGNSFSLFAARMLAKPYHFGVNNLTTLCENKDGAHFFTLKLTSYYCVILKMVILHDAIKTIQNGVFPLSLKKERNLVSLKKRVFLNPGCQERKPSSLNRFVKLTDVRHS